MRSPYSCDQLNFVTGAVADGSFDSGGSMMELGSGITGDQGLNSPDTEVGDCPL